MNALIDKFNQLVDGPDFAKLVLRIGFGGFFLLHGIHKLFGDLSFIEGKFVEFGMPAFFAYAVYLGEVVAPVLIIIGLWTRLSAFIGVASSVVIVILMHADHLFTLSKTGAWVIEPVGTFLVGFLAIMLLGSGKYAVKPD